MEKFILLLSVPIFVLASCAKDNGGDGSHSTISIDPLITKATETDFEKGDSIGVTIIRTEGEYATNAKMVHDGSLFRSDIYWYTSGEQVSKFRAYYPYSKSVPTAWTVASDQSKSVTGSDLMASVKEEVTPQSAVAMVFKHLLTKIVVNIDNQASAVVGSVVLCNSRPTAKLDLSIPEVIVDESASPADIIACAVTANTKYAAIVIPQTVKFSVSVNLRDGKTITKSLSEVTLKSGGQYSINVVVLPSDVKMSLSGEIEAWTDEGNIPGREVPYHDYGTYFEYDGVRYNTVILKDGNRWMADNLRFLPDGYKEPVPYELTYNTEKERYEFYNMTDGVYCPVVSDGEKAVFSNDPEVVAARGYLYQSEVALGKTVGSINTEEEAKALEGAQGICPPGWHIPTGEEYRNLVGNIAQYPDGDKTDAPYYGDGKGRISKINADGFNLDACGAVSITNNTMTAATLMGCLKDFTDKISSGFVCGSTYAAKSETEGVVTNIMFYGLMPMTNSTSVTDHTCSGSKVGYRIAASVRCIADHS